MLVFKGISFIQRKFIHVSSMPLGATQTASGNKHLKQFRYYVIIRDLLCQRLHIQDVGLCQRSGEGVCCFLSFMLFIYNMIQNYVHLYERQIRNSTISSDFTRCFLFMLKYYRVSFGSARQVFIRLSRDYQKISAFVFRFLGPIT